MLREEDVSKWNKRGTKVYIETERDMYETLTWN